MCSERCKIPPSYNTCKNVRFPYCSSFFYEIFLRQEEEGGNLGEGKKIRDVIFLPLPFHIVYYKLAGAGLRVKYNPPTFRLISRNKKRGKKKKATIVNRREKNNARIESPFYPRPSFCPTTISTFFLKGFCEIAVRKGGRIESRAEFFLVNFFFSLPPEKSFFLPDP